MSTVKADVKALLVGILGIVLATCQTDTSLQEIDQIVISNSENNSMKINSFELTSSSTINYLLDLINTIESMVEDGLLNKGNANALIVKIENAIKSIENGNTNASSGQLNALINEIEDFIDNGTLPVEEGQSLVTIADYLDKFINQEPIITDGLIAFYPFNNNTNDESGNERHGESSNITFTQDRNEMINAAVSFNGDGFIILQEIGQTNESFSIALWYKTETSGTVLATDNIFMGADNVYNQFIVSWNTNIGTYAAAGNPVYFDNTWHHVVITHDANDSRIVTYFDGAVRHNRPNSGYFLGNNEEIYIGIVAKDYNVSFPYINPYFIGSIDDIYFFDRAISVEEVEQLFYYPK